MIWESYNELHALPRPRPYWEMKQRFLKKKQIIWGLKRPTIGRRRPLAGLRFRANSQDVHEKGNNARRRRGDCIPFVFSLRAFFQIQFCKFLKMTKNSTTTGLLSARNNSRLRWGAGYEAENIRSPYHIFLFTLTVIKTSSHAFRLAALSWL